MRGRARWFQCLWEKDKINSEHNEKIRCKTSEFFVMGHINYKLGPNLQEAFPSLVDITADPEETPKMNKDS